MTEWEFRQLVAQHEMTCRADPKGFTRLTALMALAGQALLVLVMAGCAWGLVLLVQRYQSGQSLRVWMLLLGLGAASLLLSLVRALWQRSAPIDGLLVQRKQLPRLFDLIDKVRARCNAPRVDKVFLAADLNACVVQQARLGVLGWHRNVLVLGLPLLMALDVKQLAAVLAHEFGHLRGAHGKLGAWIYRTRRSWWALAESRQRSRVSLWGADWALGLFFGYFFPRFNARAFVLSRQQEVLADRLAMRRIGPKATAQSLLSLAVHSRYLEEIFWPRVWAQAVNQPQPLVRPLRDMRKMIRFVLEHHRAPVWLRDALRALPSPTDTHPSLRDRLLQAEIRPDMPPVPEHSAAEMLLGKQFGALQDALDQRWCQQVAEPWTARHRWGRERQRLLTELNETATTTQLGQDDGLLRARLTQQLHGHGVAMRLWRKYARHFPQALEPHFRIGVGLLEIHGPVASHHQQLALPDDLTEAVRQLRHVMNADGPGVDRRWSRLAAHALEQLLEQREDLVALRPVRDRTRELDKEYERAQKALTDFQSFKSAKETPMELCATELGPRTLRDTLVMLRNEPAVGRVWLIQRTVAEAPGWPLHLLVIERTKVWGQPPVDTWWSELHARIDLPLEFMVIDLSHPYWADSARAPLVELLREVPRACVFARGGNTNTV